MLLLLLCIFFFFHLTHPGKLDEAVVVKVILDAQVVAVSETRNGKDEYIDMIVQVYFYRFLLCFSIDWLIQRERYPWQLWLCIEYG